MSENFTINNNVVNEKILEFNNSDRNLIKSIGDTFTISLEFELETLDKAGKNNISNDKAISIIKDYAIKYVNSRNKDEKFYKKSINNLISELDFDDDYDDYNTNIFDEYIKGTRNKFEKDLYRVMYSDYLTYWRSDNIDYLTNKVIEHLPNFYKKWNSKLKFELDNTLNRGIEFSLKRYEIGIDNAISLINDFYEDYDKQSYWIMDDTTGIHINIGVTYKVKWNPLKGLLMISDNGEDSFTFKDMEWREKSYYTKTFLPKLKEEIMKDKEILKHRTFNDIKNLEDKFNDFIIKKEEKVYKNYGFNVTRIKNLDYVEFRYPGGKMPKSVLIDKLYYFCYIAYNMSNDNYNRKKYIKKLYSFLSNF